MAQSHHHEMECRAADLSVQLEKALSANAMLEGRNQLLEQFVGLQVPPAVPGSRAGTHASAPQGCCHRGGGRGATTRVPPACGVLSWAAPSGAARGSRRRARRGEGGRAVAGQARGGGRGGGGARGAVVAGRSHPPDGRAAPQPVRHADLHPAGRPPHQSHPRPGAPPHLPDSPGVCVPNPAGACCLLCNHGHFLAMD